MFYQLRDDTKRHFEDKAAILIVASIYGMFLLYMQCSKHRWVITHPQTLWDYLSLIHSELSVYFVVVTILVLAVRTNWLSFFFLSVYFMMSIADWATWFILQRPFHFTDLLRLIEFANYYQDITMYYLNLVIKLCCIITSMILSGGLLWYLLRLKRKTWRQYTGNGALFILIGYVIIIPFAAGVHEDYQNTFVYMYRQMAYEFRLAHMRIDDTELRRLLGTSQNQSLLHVQPLKISSVIIFVMETAPWEHYAALLTSKSQEIRHAFGLKSWIFDEHYTTYPESDRAVLSMLTGRYPPLNRGTGWVRSYDYSGSLPLVLKQYGYKTYLLSTAPLDFHDNSYMMQSLGFDTIVDSSLAKKAISIENNQRRFKRDQIYAADLEMISKAKGIISSAGLIKYLLVITPQSSHAPFQRPPGYNGKGDDTSLIKANALWQSNLLRELIHTLSAEKQLERACVIVTGDHGLRHPAESVLSPNMNRLSSATFHVPCLLFTSQDPPPIQAKPTSHIDIVPTLCDLLGVPYEATRYHGISMLQNVQRSVFFLGGEYLPVSGFVRNGTYYMENRNEGRVLASSTFDFNTDSNKISSYHGAKRAFVSHDLEIMQALLLNGRR